MGIKIVLGLQWGDEGKGKVVDWLAEEASYVVRGQGGNNAGHTVLVQDEEYKLHLVPSGILHPKVHCYIGPGVVVDPLVLLQELEGLSKRGIDWNDRLRISPGAHLILPHQIALDRLVESRAGEERIGTTGRGIGPCYADKVRRVGVRCADLEDPGVFLEGCRRALLANPPLFERDEHSKLIDHAAELSPFVARASALAPFVESLEERILLALKKGETCLLEGAQGAWLDINAGTYPYVTSSETSAAGICAGANLPLSQVSQIIGVVKSYTTRVGEGPLPTALTSEEEELFGSKEAAREIGTTTGRARRLGWWDGVLVRRSAQLNGCTELVVTKLDILDHLSELRICTEYRYRTRPGAGVPHSPLAWNDVMPQYETLSGWRSSTSECRRWEDLPSAARAYLDRIEELCGVPVTCVSLGPARHQTLHRP